MNNKRSWVEKEILYSAFYLTGNSAGNTAKQKGTDVLTMSIYIKRQVAINDHGHKMIDKFMQRRYDR